MRKFMIVGVHPVFAETRYILGRSMFGKLLVSNLSGFEYPTLEQAERDLAEAQKLAANHNWQIEEC